VVPTYFFKHIKLARKGLTGALWIRFEVSQWHRKQRQLVSVLSILFQSDIWPK